jgi:hypothetical protein
MDGAIAAGLDDVESKDRAVQELLEVVRQEGISNIVACGGVVYAVIGYATAFLTRSAVQPLRLT